MLKAIFTAVLIVSLGSATRISFSGHEDGKSLAIASAGDLRQLNVSNIAQSSNVAHAMQTSLLNVSRILRRAYAQEFVLSHHDEGGPELAKDDPFPWNEEEDSRPSSANKIIKGTNGKSYKYTKKLQAGGQGEVWSAVVDKKKVAIKVSKQRRRAMDSITKGHLYDEVQYMEQLVECENVVHILDYFQDKAGFYYIVMEFVAEELLTKVIEATRFPEKQAHKVFVDLVTGLECMHTHQVVHLDIKLENVLLSGDEAKLCDFGLSSTITSGKKITVGTRGYRAPEILKDNAFDGTKVDVFALGVVLFSMVAGTPPFDDRSFGSYSSRNGYQKHLDRTLSRHVGQDFIDVIRCMLAEDPDTRCSISDIKGKSWFNKDFNVQHQ